MTNAIIMAISIALNQEFGDDYDILMEENRQDLKEPCFFISCLNPSIGRYPGGRYLRRNQFCIQYFPQTQDINKECLAVAERLSWCLEEIFMDSDLIRGTGMRYEVIDGILNFFVDYNFFVRKLKNENASMESIESEQNVKG